ncbi:MAG TPA: flavodoxin family protein [Victivallales bacterium]|nr:flavodoxin family protein [Victivallales bacterium]
MKAVVVFHSVGGNCFLIAKEFHKALNNNNIQTELYRVKDEDLEHWSTVQESNKEFYKSIVEIQVATPEIVLDADLLVFGSPTYFANFSAEMHAFHDSLAIYWPENRLWNKKFACFTSASVGESGGSHCAQSFINFALNFGMNPIPVPVPVQFETGVSPSGIIHISGPKSDIRPNNSIKLAVKLYSETLAKLLS